MLIMCIFPLRADDDVWRVCDGVQVLCEVMECTTAVKESDPIVLRYCLSECLVHLLEERFGKSFLARSTLLRETALAFPEAIANAINIPCVRMACVSHTPAFKLRFSHRH